MIRALYSARTGMNGQQTQLDVISNNLANVNTGGFKKSRTQFEDLFYQSLRSVGAETVGGGNVPTGVQVGLGTRVTSVQKIFTQGDYVNTGNDLFQLQTIFLNGNNTYREHVMVSCKPNFSLHFVILFKLFC